jgi:hypothetical protein
MLRVATATVLGIDWLIWDDMVGFYLPGSGYYIFPDG